MNSNSATYTIFVNAIIANSRGDILFVRRAPDDPYLPGYYELPGGKVRVGENLEQSIRSCILTELGIADTELQYHSSKTYINNEGPYMRVYFIAHTTSTDMRLSAAHDTSAWISVHSSAQYEVISDFDDIISKDIDDKKTTYIVYTDGGSRGNPGPSASAYLVFDTNGNLCLKGGEYAGVGTNNRAEYTAVLLALKALAKVAGKNDTIEFRADSLLVVNQLQGVYKVRNRDLWPIHEAVLTLVKRFKRVTFTHIPREQNTKADASVNEILDAHHDLL